MYKKQKHILQKLDVVNKCKTLRKMYTVKNCSV